MLMETDSSCSTSQSGFGLLKYFPSFKSTIQIDSALQTEFQKTYTDWPKDALYKDTKSLSEAGLYYTGIGDIVRCFKCHNLFYEWEQTDNPTKTHIEFSPDCKRISALDDKEILPYDENMVYWKNRYKTFDSCQLNSTERDVLSKAGFYYTNVGNIVKCFACKIVIGDWKMTDDVLNRHKNESPSCKYVKNSESDTDDDFDFDETDEGYTSYCSGPYHPEYALLSKRLETFTNFPRCIKPNAKDLAKAGFFYTNVGDKVKCYYCDGVLMHWEPKDDPWKEHSRWFPDCNFIRVMKGDMLSQSNKDNKNIETFIKINTCRVCDKEKPTELSVPCGHLAACSKCSKNLRNCSYCYKKIRKTVHIFQ